MVQWSLWSYIWINCELNQVIVLAIFSEKGKKLWYWYLYCVKREKEDRQMAFPQLTASITHHHQHHPELNQASHMKHHDAFFLVFEINFICKNVLTKFEILHSNPYNIGKICFFSNFFLSCFFILKFKLSLKYISM